ncbi:hypothetical protein IscW_ISCW011203 [Ixodes scapularis]|uniref:Uncharacterized protein n=1 Tax=Ixodes scapularis TaxID=6945 RepID=B7Q5V0_IXOSC|nr:hypothetical protein IscW_ISCW011203 [Ixodes scapularis]|eukprot:XP_002411822.1 hypothetical protein IscW_ISCW011203 [Ixodes scapularis]
MLRKLSEHVELTGVTLDTVKKIVFTGGCISTTLGRKIRSQFSLECFRNMYGLSEALSPACIPCWDETDFDNIGFPASLVQFKVSS